MIFFQMIYNFFPMIYKFFPMIYNILPMIYDLVFHKEPGLRGSVRLEQNDCLRDENATIRTVPSYPINRSLLRHSQHCADSQRQLPYKGSHRTRQAGSRQNPLLSCSLSSQVCTELDDPCTRPNKFKNPSFAKQSRQLVPDRSERAECSTKRPSSRV